MSTKGYIYYDHLTEAYNDSIDQSVNLCAEFEAIVRVEFNQGFLFIEWNSNSMPKKLRFPASDVKNLEIDMDGLLVTFDYDSETGKAIYNKEIENFSV